MTTQTPFSADAYNMACSQLPEAVDEEVREALAQKLHDTVADFKLNSDFADEIKDAEDEELTLDDEEDEDNDEAE